jgi:hypothetical protein
VADDNRATPGPTPARYGFSALNAIIEIGGRVWVANAGTNSMTEIASK